MTGFFAHLLPHTPQLKPPVYFFLESSFGHWANTDVFGASKRVDYLLVGTRSGVTICNNILAHIILYDCIMLEMTCSIHKV
jgi:hypothetical protein